MIMFGPVGREVLGVGYWLRASLSSRNRRASEP